MTDHEHADVTIRAKEPDHLERAHGLDLRLLHPWPGLDSPFRGAWCVLRQDFRHFRTDRITAAQVSEKRFGRRRAVLVKEWNAYWQAEQARRQAQNHPS